MKTFEKKNSNILHGLTLQIHFRNKAQVRSRAIPPRTPPAMYRTKANTSPVNGMIYLHYTGTGPGPGQGLGMGLMGSNVLHRNIQSGPGKVSGLIVTVVTARNEVGAR